MKTPAAHSLRIILYPQHKLSRSAMHSVATAAGVAIVIRAGFDGPWWWAIASYVGTFVGMHVLAVPFMTAFQACRDWVERRVRSIVEEELIAFDLRTYERQFGRVFPSRGAPPAPDEPGSRNVPV